MYLNRTICNVLDEMRELDKTKNYSGLLGLIEEAQSMANRMEAKLRDVKDLEYVRESIKEEEKKLKRLRAEVESES